MGGGGDAASGTRSTPDAGGLNIFRGVVEEAKKDASRGRKVGGAREGDVGAKTRGFEPARAPRAVLATGSRDARTHRLSATSSRNPCRAPGLIQLPTLLSQTGCARSCAFAGSILVRLELHLPGLLLAYRVYRAVRPPGAEASHVRTRTWARESAPGRARERLEKEREPVETKRTERILEPNPDARPFAFDPGLDHGPLKCGALWRKRKDRWRRFPRRRLGRRAALPGRRPAANPPARRRPGWRRSRSRSSRTRRARP